VSGRGDAGSIEELLCLVRAGCVEPGGEHGSTVKLAHAVAGLFLNAYRAGGRSLPEPVAEGLAGLLDADVDDSRERHAAIGEAASALARGLVRKAGDGVGLDSIGTLGDRAGSLLLAGMLHAPYLATAHHHAGSRAGLHELETAFSEALERYVDWFYRQCDTVLAPTHAVAHELSARGVGTHLGVWARGVDAQLFAPGRRCADLRAELLDGGRFLLLSVGRVSPEKRLDVLLAAFARLRKRIDGARLVIVGEGPARASLESVAPEGVSFLGEVRGERLAQVFASADVFCFSSTTDTFGQVLIEAGASGLPVVAAAAGGAPEVVQHGKTGLLVTPDDAEELADALGRLAVDDELRRRLGRGGRVNALGRTWARSFIELRTAYRAAVAPPAPPRPEKRALV
jgi:glycosyltransferase involved in cell wall biosynthesis